MQHLNTITALTVGNRIQAPRLPVGISADCLKHKLPALACSKVQEVLLGSVGPQRECTQTAPPNRYIHAKTYRKLIYSAISRLIKSVCLHTGGHSSLSGSCTEGYCHRFAVTLGKSLHPGAPTSVRNTPCSELCEIHGRRAL